MKTESARRDRRIRTMPAIGFALTMLFVSVQSANAQWTPPSTSPTPNTNIYYDAGNIGIGTTSPGSARLRVDPAANNFAIVTTGADDFNTVYLKGSSTTSHSYGLIIDAGTNSNDSALQVRNASSGSTYFYIRGDGNAGIGTTSPLAKFHVEGAASTYAGYFHGNLASGQSLGVLIDAGANTSDYPFRVRSYNSVDYFAVRGDGNVGIGTPSPGQKLDVVGNINVSGTGAGNITASGTINAKYQDVAEWVPASEQLSAGTVVVLDSSKSNQVTSSSVSYDTRVAGVVSEQPGIALGEKSEGKVLVATTGRVRVKVDASKGAIHIGDLLVTSDVPGMAMKSEPMMIGGRQLHAPGTLIGKALEPLEKGSGTILVLLSLQ